MIECRICGFPKKFARYFDWRSDGTIISKDRSGVRSQITFLESGEFENLFDSLSSKIGIPVDTFLIKAQKNIGKEILASLPIRHIKRFPVNRFLRPQFLARTMVALVRQDVAGLGDGRLTLDGYRAGEYLKLRYHNPCAVPLLVGSAMGIYESIEPMPGADVDHRIEKNGDLVIEMRYGEAADESAGRLYLEEVVPGEGPVVYERCPKCTAPRLASKALKWDLSEGIIRNRLSGRREVIIAVQSVNAILRELEGELGEEVTDLAYDIQKDLTRGRIDDASADDPEHFLERYTMNLALRGLGYPLAVERGDRSLDIRIGNAYNQILYAAKMAAALEKLTGKPSAIEWSERSADHGSYRITAPD